MARIFGLAAVSLTALLTAGSFAQETTGSVNPAGKVLTGAEAFGDWKEDAPGVIRHIQVADLKPPGMTESASNGPDNVAMPEGILPKVPDGFTVEMVASGLENPRVIRFAPNGDLFVSNSPCQFLSILGRAGERRRRLRRGAQPPTACFYPAATKPSDLHRRKRGRALPYKVATNAPESRCAQPSSRSSRRAPLDRDIAFLVDGRHVIRSSGSMSART